MPTCFPKAFFLVNDIITEAIHFSGLEFLCTAASSRVARCELYGKNRTQAYIFHPKLLGPFPHRMTADLSLSITYTDTAIRCEAGQKPVEGWKKPQIDLLWTDLYQSYKQFKAWKKSRLASPVAEDGSKAQSSLSFPTSVFFFSLIQLLKAKAVGGGSTHCRRLFGSHTPARGSLPAATPCIVTKHIL